MDIIHFFIPLFSGWMHEGAGKSTCKNSGCLLHGKPNKFVLCIWVRIVDVMQMLMYQISRHYYRNIKGSHCFCLDAIPSSIEAIRAYLMCCNVQTRIRHDFGFIQ